MKSNFHAGAIITGSVGIAIGDAMNNKLQKNNKITVCIWRRCGTARIILGSDKLFDS